MHRNHNEADRLTSDERLREIARIFAAGVLRLHSRVALPTTRAQLPGPQNLPKSAPNCLEVPREVRLSVHPG